MSTCTRADWYAMHGSLMQCMLAASLQCSCNSTLAAAEQLLRAVEAAWLLAHLLIVVNGLCACILCMVCGRLYTYESTCQSQASGIHCVLDHSRPSMQAPAACMQLAQPVAAATTAAAAGLRELAGGGRQRCSAQLQHVLQSHAPSGT